MKKLAFTTLFLATLIIAMSPIESAASSRSQDSFVSTTVVLNEIYGGAGCGTAGCSTFKNDFIELKNISVGLVDISGWAVQYASATGTGWQVTTIPANTVLRPGDTYLIAQSFGTNGVNNLPTPNLTGTIAMAGTAGKVALTNTNTALTGACPTGAAIVDFVGYGATASCNETANTTAPSTTTSIMRNAAGLDTDNNSTDFSTSGPTPSAAVNPTAAGVGVAGRVITESGQGIGRVLVTVTGGDLVTPRTAISSPFGYYLVDDLTAGTTYIVSVSSKQYAFNTPSRVVTLGDNIADLDFIAVTPPPTLRSILKGQ